MNGAFLFKLEHMLQAVAFVTALILAVTGHYVTGLSVFLGTYLTVMTLNMFVIPDETYAEWEEARIEELDEDEKEKLLFNGD